jgi:hypothetical protein
MNNPIKCSVFGCTGKATMVTEGHPALHLCEKHAINSKLFYTLRKMSEGKRGNPKVNVSALAVEAKKKYRDDIKAGHKDGAEYWAGAAGTGFLMSNPTEFHPLTPQYEAGVHYTRDPKLAKKLGMTEKHIYLWENVPTGKRGTGYFFTYPVFQYGDDPNKLIAKWNGGGTGQWRYKLMENNPYPYPEKAPAVHWAIAGAKGERAACGLKGRHMPYWQGSKDVRKVTCKDCLKRLGARNPSYDDTQGDPTEAMRRGLVAGIGSQVESDDKASERKRLEAQYGKVWDTDEVRAEFKVLGFMAPFVIVEQKSTGNKGTLTFQHHPRFYFEFEQANPLPFMHRSMPSLNNPAPKNYITLRHKPVQAVKDTGTWEVQIVGDIHDLNRGRLRDYQNLAGSSMAPTTRMSGDLVEIAFYFDTKGAAESAIERLDAHPDFKKSNPILPLLGESLLTGLGLGAGYIISRKVLDGSRAKKKKK